MNNSFIMLQGKLSVTARGYWYTSGGEKGAFGYYPHLKDTKQYPVYPDTQIRGDLRVAVQWLDELSLGKPHEKLIRKMFGQRGDEQSGILYLKDLSLTSTAQAQWSTARFDIKSRIEIDDETRSVKENMLASFEAAWLDGLVLESTIHAGYFTNVDEAKLARQLLEEAFPLVSGFGAFRSRGYGRATIKIDWEPLELITLEPQHITGKSYNYALKNLVNMRSKPVAAEHLQLVATNSSITAEQLRGWFVRTYQKITGTWPDADAMTSITFSSLFPSPSIGEPAFPPANTTLRREDDTSIDDYWGISQEDVTSQDKHSKTTEKYKLKPLKPGTFITKSGKIARAEIGVRMRNAINDNFTTLDEGGLFVQQYVASGTVFCGKIVFTDPGSEFCRIAKVILSQLKPEINGSVFESTISEAKNDGVGTHRVRLVTVPIPFDPNKKFNDDESITLGTRRIYAAALGRPRRGKPVILPGSVIINHLDGTEDWPLFGKNIVTKNHCDKRVPIPQKPDCKVPLPKSNIQWDKITRSQAGILRELLNPEHNTTVIGDYLFHIKEKHNEKDQNSDLAKLYTALTVIQEDGGVEGLMSTVEQVLEHLKIEIWWEQKSCILKEGQNQ